VTLALITGAKGFIGRHLAYKLAQSGVTAIGLGHGAWLNHEFSPWGISDWLNGDITPSNLNRLFSDNPLPDHIFHLAGGSAVGPSFSTPEEDFRRSVDSTFSLLEWTRNASPHSSIVLASSASVYGSIHSKPILETDLTHPYSPYGYHKRITELLCESFAQNFSLSISIVRLFSVYGPELKKQLLWDLCMRLKENPSELLLSGTGQEVRDWIHVTDAALYLIQAAALSSPDKFLLNGGTGIETSVRQVAERLRDAYGLKTEIKFSGQSRKGDPQYLVANIDRGIIHKFNPHKTWENGFNEYVEWFRRGKES
jgi:UDP-glucose 4-epimerase